MRKTSRVAGSIDPEQLLRGAALRVTRPRVAVLTAVHAMPHADTDAVIGAVRAELPTVSHQAVYDSLRALTEAGLVRRIQPAGSTARYESRVGDNHHHIVCRDCGRIEDADFSAGEAPRPRLPEHADFTIDRAEIVYWGRCASCTATADPAPGHPS